MLHAARQLPSWLIFDVGQKMLRSLLILFALAVAAYANPIAAPRGSSKPVKPVFQSVMVEEWVTVTVSDAGASVFGRFRFRDAPDSASPPSRYVQTIELPVPIPPSLANFEDVATVVSPILLARGRSYRPEKSLRYPVGMSLPDSLKLVLFTFTVERTNREKEIALEIRYEQPVISIGGKDLVYYIPFLPHFQRYAEQMNLRADAFQIGFEAVGAVQLISSKGQEARSFTVQAKHKEVIAVERQRPNKAPEPTPGSVTPRATEPSPK